MKISKTALLISGGVFTMLSLGLMFVDAQVTINLKTDVGNAIQHMRNLDIVRTGVDAKPFVTVFGQSGSVSIDLKGNYNFILSNTGEKLNEIYSGQAKGNSILGGIKNVIKGGNDSVILGGDSNLLSGDYSVILGGNGNTLTGNYSAILGGKDNELTGSASSVVGGESNKIKGNHSVIVGSSNNVSGNYSVALGQKSNVSANNSFLWTDSNHDEGLLASNVFAVVSNNGMVINTDKAHSFAQLTIGGPMIVLHKGNEGNIACDSSNGGVMKVMNNTDAGTVCLCSCDGTSRNSMFGKGNCSSRCDDSIAPKCGSDVERIRNSVNSNYYYSGSCIVGEVLEGTGSYFVDKNNVVHWTCQTEDGVTMPCTGNV